WQWDAHLSRRRDGFARSRRLPARGPRWNSIRRRDGAVPARAQSVRADFLHRLSDTEDRPVSRFHLYIRHRNAFEDRIHLSRMSLSDRGDVLFRLSRGADAADLERAKLRRRPSHNSAAGHFAGDDAQHFFGAAGRTAGGDHRGGYHRNDRDSIGLGYYITIWSTRFTFANVYAAIIVIGICGLVLDQALLLFRHRAVYWQRDGS